MLDKAGVYDTDAEIKGPTQVRNTSLIRSHQQKAAFVFSFTRQLHCSLKEQKACNLYLLEMFSSVKIMFIWIKGPNREYYPIGKFGTVHVYCMFSRMQIVNTENMVDCIN